MLDHDAHSIYPFWITLGGHTIIPCMGSYWLAYTLAILCSGICAGYLIIAKEWNRLENLTDDPDGKAVLRLLREIFIWCAITGYGFIVIRTLFPFWSLYIASLVWLNYLTFSYVFKVRSLRKPNP